MNEQVVLNIPEDGWEEIKSPFHIAATVSLEERRPRALKHADGRLVRSVHDMRGKST